MLEIKNNKELFEDHRAKSLAFIREQSDSKVVFDEFFRVVNNETSNLIFDNGDW